MSEDTSMLAIKALDARAKHRALYARLNAFTVSLRASMGLGLAEYTRTEFVLEQLDAILNDPDVKP